jgi:hypothetical protein
MPIHNLGKCRPGKWGGCKAPLTSEQLWSVFSNLDEIRRQGVANLVIPGQIHTPLPPNSVNHLNAAISHPDVSKIGMMHWRKLDTIVLRIDALEKAIASGHFQPGMDYAALVKALELQGLSTVDIDYIPDS